MSGPPVVLALVEAPPECSSSTFWRLRTLAHLLVFDAPNSCRSSVWVSQAGSRRLDETSVEAIDGTDHPLHAVPLDDLGTGQPCPALRFGRVVSRVDQRLCQAFWIAGRHEHAGNPVRDQVGHATDPRGDDGASGRHRFDGSHRCPFVVRGHHEQVGVGIDGRQIASPAEEEHLRSKIELGSELLCGCPLITITHHEDNRLGVFGNDRPGGPQEERVVFDRGDTPHDQRQLFLPVAEDAIGRFVDPPRVV